MPKAKGSEIKVGDDLIFLGTPHRITDIVPYRHPNAGKYGWPTWFTAYARTTEPVITPLTWGITIEPGIEYEIGVK